MYISIGQFTVAAGKASEATAASQTAHDAMRGLDGLRWAMLLHSTDDAAKFAAVSMWLTPEHAAAWRESAAAGSYAEVLHDTASDSAEHGYDVTTARGAMTPASHAAIVEWEVEPERAAGFASRWNAAYHAVEDAIGSRLLQDLERPQRYVGLHVVTNDAALKSDVLMAEIKDREGPGLRPESVARFSVVLLTEV
jgi:heme-degrading monooxygenase HmoA